MQLKDQAAIVTGGASGLGAATARKLAGQGAKVAVCDLNAKLAESVAAEIGGVAVVCDVSDAASAEAAIAQAAKAHGVVVHPSPKLDVAVVWQSPVDAVVRLQVNVAHAHPACGNGVIWAIEGIEMPTSDVTCAV